MISIEEAMDITRIWLETPFEGGRHLRRIRQIEDLEQNTFRSDPED
jgi:ribose 5-phosphate isomerase RpiB